MRSQFPFLINPLWEKITTWEIFLYSHTLIVRPSRVPLRLRETKVFGKPSPSQLTKLRTTTNGFCFIVTVVSTKFILSPGYLSFFNHHSDWKDRGRKWLNVPRPWYVKVGDNSSPSAAVISLDKLLRYFCQAAVGKALFLLYIWAK